MVLNVYMVVCRDIKRSLSFHTRIETTFFLMSCDCSFINLYVSGRGRGDGFMQRGVSYEEGEGGFGRPRGPRPEGWEEM